MTTAERQLAAGPTDRIDVPDPAGPPLAGIGRSAAWPALRTMALAGTTYILLSLGVWWHVWTGHPSTTTTCGCSDSSLFQWFLAWPAYAISHGLDPWYASDMFYPHGINLLSNTAVVGVGVVLAPVTWLFGPIATFNVAITLAPALSAFAMFVLLRRWVAWAPAAFFGGLLYGFSPFILIELTDGHLMLAMAPMPPLLVLCLDELLARQRRSPVMGGVLLGLVVTVQFFIGTEVLLIVSIAAAIGIVLTLIYGAVHRDVLLRRVRHAALGLAAASATVAVLLAYPTWFALAGPAHLSGPIWGSDLISYEGTNVHDFFLPARSYPQVLSLAHRFGGYQALSFSGQYLGIGLIVVLVTGLVVRWRDPRLWLFAIVGVIAVPLSMGLAPSGSPTLWGFFVHFPLLNNVIPGRFLIVTYLCAAVMLGLIIDHTRTSFGRWVDVRDVRGSDDHARLATRWRPAGSWAAIGVSLIALVPILAYLAGNLPFTTQSVELPKWFETVGPHVASGAVVITFPVPWDFRTSSLTWQAVDGMSFAQVGGGGPEAISSRAGKEEAGQSYLGEVSIDGGQLTITPNGVAVSRQALNVWGVTTIVVPDTHSLPTYERLHAVRSAVVLMTAATGRLPTRRADAWVWTDVEQSPPPVLPSSAALAACNGGSQSGPVASIERSAACVLAAASQP